MHLELGGKAPVIVFDDADVEALVATLTEIGYYNSGQDCTAPCRVIAGPGVFDDLVAGLTDARRQDRRPATRSTDDTAMGPVISADQLDARQRHGRPRASTPAPRSRPAAQRATGAGFFYEPSVVVNPAQDSEIVQREVFGPVVTVQRFADEDAGARVGERRRLRPVGERVDHATSAARCAWPRALQFGCVWVNDHIPIVVGDAPRRLQAVGLRQGHVDLRDRALHRAQARDGQALMTDRSRATATDAIDHRARREIADDRDGRLLDRTAGVEALYERASQHAAARRRLVVPGRRPVPDLPRARATGSRVWDVDGNEYVDFHGGFGCMVVGHAHPKIVEAIDARRAHRHALRGADRDDGALRRGALPALPARAGALRATRAPRRR